MITVFERCDEAPPGTATKRKRKSMLLRQRPSSTRVPHTLLLYIRQPCAARIWPIASCFDAGVNFLYPAMAGSVAPRATREFLACKSGDSNPSAYRGWSAFHVRINRLHGKVERPRSQIGAFLISLPSSILGTSERNRLHSLGMRLEGGRTVRGIGGRAF